MKIVTRILATLLVLGVIVLGWFFTRETVPAAVLSAREYNAESLIKGMRDAFANEERRAKLGLQMREDMICMLLDSAGTEYILVSKAGDLSEIQLSPNNGADKYVDRNGDGSLDSCDCAIGRDNPAENQKLYEDQVMDALKKLARAPLVIPPTPSS